MTPEAERYLDKSHQCLANARTSLSVNLTNDAGRGAYLATFHAAQALIFERTGKISKSHQGVHSQFALLAKSDARIAPGWVGEKGTSHISPVIAERGPPRIPTGRGSQFVRGSHLGTMPDRLNCGMSPFPLGGAQPMKTPVVQRYTVCAPGTSSVKFLPVLVKQV